MSRKVRPGQRVLVAGASGMLGRALASLLLGAGYEVVAPGRPELDITELQAVRALVRGVAPAAVINCAAYTAVDKAEDERGKAELINREGAANLSRAAADAGAKFIHISTDFVFDGTKNTPYSEDDEPAPVGVYGSSKLAGEDKVIAAGGDFFIVRTSWLYGPGSDNFVTKIAGKARSSKELRVVFDQVGTPTYTFDLAEAIINLTELELDNGIYHFSNEGVASWYDFAVAVVEGLKRRGAGLSVERIEPVLSAAYKTPAKRPSYSVMDKAKYKKATGAHVRHWGEALSSYLETTLKDGRIKL
ncbi:dTDP-4-dehydrorhamnose reductase [hydrothermal vent metagenome]|uniref:dTDP-4-dehydrorhamnose reductase n=1 Tax=hydrothermal vent metagenome TaxID=652676 RepID=A0A3B0VAU6_9ZZZZ